MRDTRGRERIRVYLKSGHVFFLITFQRTSLVNSQHWKISRLLIIKSYYVTRIERSWKIFFQFDIFFFGGGGRWEGRQFSISIFISFLFFFFCSFFLTFFFLTSSFRLVKLMRWRHPNCKPKMNELIRGSIAQVPLNFPPRFSRPAFSLPKSTKKFSD